MQRLMTCLLVLAIAAPGMAEDLDIGLKGKDYSARVVLGGLSNPSSVSFSCDQRWSRRRR